MIAAICCRKRSEQNGTADEAKSVARQRSTREPMRSARVGRSATAAYSWTTGSAGAEFAGRPGFVKLMASLKPSRGSTC